MQQFKKRAEPGCPAQEHETYVHITSTLQNDSSTWFLPETLFASGLLKFSPPGFKFSPPGANFYFKPSTESAALFKKVEIAESAALANGLLPTLLTSICECVAIGCTYACVQCCEPARNVSNGNGNHGASYFPNGLKATGYPNTSACVSTESTK